ncbi:MAG TPA: GTPase HflX, partial [Actinomycetota bacterium]|nr:GTPase HflX [Actinomycetota bacterium]
ADLERTRLVKRKQRTRAGASVIALVGYTNAGKSTLLRRLTSADVLVQDQLFSTLDPTTRRLSLPGEREALLTDTVGFVRKLPHQLVEAFRSTLEEVREATLLLHVVDGSRDVERQIAAVERVLADIGVTGRPTVLALNKADLLSPDDRSDLASRYPDAVSCSAATGAGMDELSERIAAELARLEVEVALDVPFQRGDVVARVHDAGEVLEESYSATGTRLVARVPRDALADLEPFLAPAEG